jgi:transposase InsO family protein
VRTTVPDQSGRTFPDLLGRDFTAPAPNCRYVGDITYLPLADGRNLYLATVIDLHSRKLAGWAMADHMRTELVEDALTAAARERGTLAGAIFHSDHGSVPDCLCPSAPRYRPDYAAGPRDTAPRRPDPLIRESIE